MAFFQEIKKKLEKYTVTSINHFYKTLNLPKCSKKEGKINLLCSFFMDPNNYTQIIRTLPKNIIEDLNELLLDPNILCICEKNKSDKIIACQSCSTKQHDSCMNRLSYMDKYECVRCQIKQMNPLDEVIEFLVSPYLISPRAVETKRFQFSRTSQHEISTGINTYEIQARCVKLENSGFVIS